MRKGKTRAASRIALAALLTLLLGAGRGAAIGGNSGLAAETAGSIDSDAFSQAPAPQPFNWEKLTQEATALLSQYIRIDTTNPPGNELGAARMLRERFLADGIPATVWEPRPGRGVVAARLRGTAKHTKAIVLLSHMDVVPANPKQWQVPPFSG